MPINMNPESLRPPERLYVLPLDDGDTVIVFKEENQPNFLRWPISSELDDNDSARLDKLSDYINKSSEETKFKMTLFKEMCRSLPPWAEIKYEWLTDLLKLSLNDSSNRVEDIVLYWLRFTLTEPKVTKIPHTCQEEALSIGYSSSSNPDKMFLLEYKELLQGDLSYGFLVPRAEDVFSLVYLFPEAGKGWMFTTCLSYAASNTSKYTLPSEEGTQIRYRVVLMLEYASHPGIVSSQDYPSELETNKKGLYRLEDTTNARIRAILLYKSTLAEPRVNTTNRVLLAFSAFSIALVLHVLYKLKLNILSGIK